MYAFGFGGFYYFYYFLGTINTLLLGTKSMTAFIKSIEDNIILSHEKTLNNPGENSHCLYRKGGKYQIKKTVQETFYKSAP